MRQVNIRDYGTHWEVGINVDGIERVEVFTGPDAETKAREYARANSQL